MGERKCVYRVCVRKPERPLGRPRRKGRITLKWITNKRDGGYELD